MLTEIITGYTQESGVRELERCMNTVASKTATDIVKKDFPKTKKFNITPTITPKLLGPKKFDRSGIERRASLVWLMDWLGHRLEGSYSILKLLQSQARVN